jgi:hypothetical protein
VPSASAQAVSFEYERGFGASLPEQKLNQGTQESRNKKTQWGPGFTFSLSRARDVGKFTA